MIHLVNVSYPQIYYFFHYPTPLSCATSGAKSPLHTHFPPHVSHREPNRPPTHFFLLMCNIRKTPTCPTRPSVPHPRIPDVSHREPNRPPTHFFLLMSNIRKTPTCPTRPSVPHPRIPHVSHREQNHHSTHFSLLMFNIRKTINLPHITGRPSAQSVRQSHLLYELSFSPSLYTRALSCMDWTKKYIRCAKGRFAHRLQLD